MEARLSTAVQGLTQPPVQWVPCLFLGGKSAGLGGNTPRSSRAEVKERVDLYFCSFSGPSWPVLGRPLHFYVRNTERLRARIAGQVPWAPACKVSQDVIGIIGNTVLVNSGFHTRKEFP